MIICNQILAEFDNYKQNETKYIEKILFINKCRNWKSGCVLVIYIKKKTPQKQLKENELKIWAKIYRVPVGPFA